MKHRLILSRHRLQLAADLRVSAARPPPPRGQGRRKLRRAEERALSEGVARLGREEASLQAYLLRRGPWRSALQMPMQYQPRLTAAPWHTVEAWRGERVAGGAQGGGRVRVDLRPLVRILEDPAAVARLRAEHARLAAGGRMQRDQDCIQEAARGSHWSRYEITAVWNPLLPSDGCSADTPAACAVLASLREASAAAGTAILRAGYRWAGVRQRQRAGERGRGRVLSGVAARW